MIFTVLSDDGSSIASSELNWTYRPMKKNDGRRTSSGIRNDLDLLFRAHISRRRLRVISGTKKIPERETGQSLAGLMTIDRYDNARSAATISIRRREVMPKNLFFFFAIR
jgi:hypothetical protein